jgi:predicted DNA-binding transcriptional regulator AlpA
VAIVPLKTIAKKRGISLRTLYRQIERGEVGPVIQLSPRRVGMDERDDEADLAGRRKPQIARQEPTAATTP